MREPSVRPFGGDEIPTSGGRTLPPPKHEPKSELETLVGELMASQASLISAWNVRNREHETAMRELNGLGKCVGELRAEMKELTVAQGHTGKKITAATRAFPAVLFLIELGRMIFTHYFPTFGG